MRYLEQAFGLLRTLVFTAYLKKETAHENTLFVRKVHYKK
jgi:hypothetical protein